MLKAFTGNTTQGTMRMRIYAATIIIYKGTPKNQIK